MALGVMVSKPPLEGYLVVWRDLYPWLGSRVLSLEELLVLAPESQLKLWGIPVRHWENWRSPVLQALWVAQRVERLVAFGERLWCGGWNRCKKRH